MPSSLRVMHPWLDPDSQWLLTTSNQFYRCSEFSCWLCLKSCTRLRCSGLSCLVPVLHCLLVLLLACLLPYLLPGLKPAWFSLFYMSSFKDNLWYSVVIVIKSAHTTATVDPSTTSGHLDKKCNNLLCTQGKLLNTEHVVVQFSTTYNCCRSISLHHDQLGIKGYSIVNTTINSNIPAIINSVMKFH